MTEVEATQIPEASIRTRNGAVSEDKGMDAAVGMDGGIETVATKAVEDDDAVETIQSEEGLEEKEGAATTIVGAEIAIVIAKI